MKQNKSIQGISMEVSAGPTWGYRFRSFTGSSFKGSWKGKSFRWSKGYQPGYGSHWGTGRGFKGGFKGYRKGGKGQGVPIPKPRRLYCDSPVSQAKAATTLVGGSCPTTRGSSHLFRCGTTLALPCVEGSSSNQKAAGPAKGFANPGRILSSGGSSKSIPGRNQIPGSLVCGVKNGTPREGKAQINFRLSNFKAVVKPKTFQTGQLERNLSTLKARHVGSKSGFKKCILPPRTLQQIKTLRTNAGGGPSVPNECSMFWTKHFASVVDASHARFSKNVARKRSNGIYLFGRHSPHWSEPEASQSTVADDVHRPEKQRHVHKLGKVQHRSQPGPAPFGVCTELGIGPFGSPVTKAQKHPEGAGKNL